MKGLKYTILPHGFIENDLAWNVAMPAPATRDNKSPTPIWGRFPTYSVLISHPTEGYILFDTGSALGDDAGRRPASMDNIFPLYSTIWRALLRRVSAVTATPLSRPPTS